MYKTMISRLEKTEKLRLLGYNLYETFDKCMQIFTRKEYPLIHDELIIPQNKLISTVYKPGGHLGPTGW